MTKKFQGTPGPWEARKPTRRELRNPAYSAEIAWIIEGDVNNLTDWSGWQVAWLTDGGKSSPPDEVDHEVSAFVDANARLIVAAPMLLEALISAEWASSAIDDRGIARVACPDCGGIISDGHEPDCDLRAAIDAAIGEGE